MLALQAGHFQLACGMAFQGVHGCACDTGINHPNQVQLRCLQTAGWMLRTAASAEVRCSRQQLQHLLRCVWQMPRAIVNAQAFCHHMMWLWLS